MLRLLFVGKTDNEIETNKETKQHTSKTKMRSSFKETVKLVFVGSLGFLLRIYFETFNPSPSCDPCPDCTIKLSQPVVEDDRFEQNDKQTQLIKPFVADDMFQVLRFDYFNKKDIFNNFDDTPRLGLLKHQKQDVTDIVKQSLALLNSDRKVPWKLQRVQNGYRRIDPLRGEEFTLDLILYPSSDKNRQEVHRLQLVKPFSPAQMLSNHQVLNNEMIHFILPISIVSDRFYRFMDNFEKSCLRVKEHVHLLLVVFAGDSPSDAELVIKIKTKVQTLSKQYSFARIEMIQTNLDFSRAAGIDLGIKRLPQDALLFFCDVDVLFWPSFLSRCRENAVLGEQVYYPIVFAQFQPNIVQKYSPAGRVKNLLEINKYTGHWVHYGFGMVCLYNKDYRDVGGFTLDIKGWGGEDVDLYNKHIKSNLKVFRAADPDLIHVYHDKHCDPGLTVDQMRMCRDSAGEGIGSKQQLGKLVMDTEVSL